MTPDQLRDALALLHWSGRGLAAILMCDERLVRRWGSGAQAVPAPVAAWLGRLAAAHEANPAPCPADWRQRETAGEP